jgi:DNA polymerase-3 subunit beta
MQISVLQERLVKGLNSVVKAIESKPPLPVLANVLIEAEDERLRIAASNLQMSITVWVGVKIDRPGTITLPAKTFTDLISRLSKERVDLTLEESTKTITVKCGSTVSTLKGIAATEYPPIKQSDEPGIVVSGKVLKSMILQTAFAAAKEDNRPILTGVYVSVEKDVLTLAAADGYRLAVRTTRLDESVAKKVEMVIPARSLIEVARLIEDEGQPLSISLPNKQNIVTFRLPNVDISSQILEGRFPDFAAIIPQRYSNRSVIDTQDWLNKCQTAEIFARDDAHSGRLILKGPDRPGGTGQLIMGGRSAERGHADSHLDAHVEGASVDMHFDIRFMVELLNVIDTDNVVFENNGADSPGVFRPQGQEDFVHVIMPLTR